MFIQLTSQSAGTPILINKTCILSVEENAEKGCVLHLSDPDRKNMKVRETYRDISNMLRAQ
jgi:hypothetical protein